MKSTFFLVAALLCGGLLHAAEVEIPEAVAKAVKNPPPHPRLFWPGNQTDALKGKILQDRTLTEAWEAVRMHADDALAEPPVVYRKEGRRLLQRSREALDRVTHLAFAARMTGDAKYVKRLEAEIRAMAGMQDWNPSHYLDTAEMTLAMAIGYDWLYDRLTPEVRALAKEAIEKKGLGPYLKPGSRLGWQHGGNNWNQVCHAGMLSGALALLEDDPQRAALVVARAIDGLPYVMHVYNPDGNYPEGPGYWNYGTTFNVMAVSILETALGSDFGVSGSPGFLKAADFPLNTMGPTGRPFNFSDSGAGAGFSPAVTWFAARTSRPELMFFEWDLLSKETQRIRETKGKASADRVFPLFLAWGRTGLEHKQPTGKTWFARGENPIATFRTSWADPNASFLAIKAGTPGASHGHMDIGSFVFDAMGERWSMDLGAENYTKLEERGIGLWDRKQGGGRWSIFRYHNRAHSTLLVNDAEQVLSSKAEILNFSADPKNAGAEINMGATYAGQLSKALRRFSFSEAGAVTVQDEITAGPKQALVRWGMTTPAKLVPGKDGSAWLESNGKKLKFQVLSPAGVEVKSWAAKPPHDYDTPNPGVSIVGFEVSLPAGKSEVLKVSLEPQAK